MFILAVLFLDSKPLPGETGQNMVDCAEVGH